MDSVKGALRDALSAISSQLSQPFPSNDQGPFALTDHPGTTKDLLVALDTAARVVSRGALTVEQDVEKAFSAISLLPGPGAGLGLSWLFFAAYGFLAVVILTQAPRQ